MRLKVTVKVAQLCPTLCDPMDYTVQEILQARLLCPWNFPGKNTGLGCHFLGIAKIPGDLPDPRIEPLSPALQEDSLPTEPPGNPWGALW